MERLPKISKRLKAGASAQPQAVKTSIKGNGSSAIKKMLGTPHRKLIHRKDGKMREIDVVDLSGGSVKSEWSQTGKEIQNQIVSKETLPTTRSFQDPTHTPTHSHSTRNPLHLSFLSSRSNKAEDSKGAAASDLETVWMDDPPSPATLLQNTLMNLNDTRPYGTQIFDASWADDASHL